MFKIVQKADWDELKDELARCKSNRDDFRDALIHKLTDRTAGIFEYLKEIQRLEQIEKDSERLKAENKSLKETIAQQSKTISELKRKELPEKMFKVFLKGRSEPIQHRGYSYEWLSFSGDFIVKDQDGMTIATFNPVESFTATVIK